MVRFLDTANSIDALRGQKIENILANEESKRAFLENLTEDEFEELVSGINGILLGKDKKDWKIDGEYVFLESLFLGEHTPPQPEDKEPLLVKTFEAMKSMVKQRRSLEDIALLISASINEIHLYKDANGRTSRCVFTLLTEDWNIETQTKMKEVLGEEGRDVVDISPGHINLDLNRLINEEGGVKDRKKNPENITNTFGWDKELLVYQEGIPEELKTDFKRVYKDHDIGFPAMLNVLQTKRNYQRFLQQFGERSVIRVDFLTPELTSELMQKFVDQYWVLKKRHAELLIDCIANPEKPEYQTQKDGEKMSIFEKFKLKIRQNQERNKKLG